MSAKILDCLIREFFFLFAIRPFHWARHEEHMGKGPRPMGNEAEQIMLLNAAKSREKK